MKKIKFNCEEEILYEVLDNGLRVFLYPTNKSKNFYITISTRFGSEVTKYKKGNKLVNIKTGSAHFLEHRVMDFTKNKEAMDKINNYGSIVNAYTTYNGTNYNMFGYENIMEHLKMLLDCVFKANIKKEDVESERGIILSEYNMYDSRPNFRLQETLNHNLFNHLYINTPVIGTTKDIKEVSYKELNNTYKDFYIPNNMFIVVVGDFDYNEVLNYVKEYTKDIKSKDIPKVIKSKEVNKVSTVYEELNNNLTTPRYIIGYKMKIPKMNKVKYDGIVGSILSENFGKTSLFYKELMDNNITRNGYGYETVDNYLCIYFNNIGNDYIKFKDILTKYLKLIKYDNETLLRKKRKYLANFILSFEDIMNIEDSITSDMFEYNKVINNLDELINSITLKDVNEVINSFDFNLSSEVLMK